MQCLNGMLLTPSEKPSLREGTGPKTYFVPVHQSIAEYFKAYKLYYFLKHGGSSVGRLSGVL